jgi:pyruvate dehydrogenase E2 component (dihydrolipoamide acetyltransferase)
MKTFNLPDLGEGLAEAEIVRWHVNVGDVVTADQPMVAVETAKAVVEVPAPFSGVIRKLHGQPGDIIATGAPLIEFDTACAATTEPAGLAPRSAASDSGTVVGHMPTSDTELIETAQPGGDSHATNGAAHVGGSDHGVHGPNGGIAATTNISGERARAAPAARALAKKLGINLAQISGSGPGGVVVVDDVLAYKTPTGSSARDTLAPAATPPFAGGEKLRGPRRAMAQSMSLARDNVTNCTIFDDADLHRWSTGQDITTRLLRAIATAARAEPALNAWFDGNTQTRRLATETNIGIAVDTPEGLIVPVIRDVGGRTADELRHEIDRLKRAARDRTAAPDDLRDATFMLSNFGMIAGRYATPVVVPPTVAILGSGRLSRDIVAVENRMETHLRMPLSLTFDHRCVTGGEAARFLAAVLRDLEKDN